MKNLFLMRLRISITTEAVCTHSNIKCLNSRGVGGGGNPDKTDPQIPHCQTLEAQNLKMLQSRSSRVHESFQPN